MIDFTSWTWVAIGVLVTVPPVVFVLFLRDARRIFRDLGSGRAENEDEPAGRRKSV